MLGSPTIYTYYIYIYTYRYIYIYIYIYILFMTSPNKLSKLIYGSYYK